MNDLPRVLFLHANGEDYLSDSLLHGLRGVLGERLVDVPRRDALYEDLPADRRARLYGRGFTLYGRLPEIAVDRDWPYARARAGEFDVVLIADVHRHWAPWVQLRPHLHELRSRGVTVAALDGGDGQVMYPYGPTWLRAARPLPPPRAHGRIRFFKRELTPTTAWIRYFGLLPPTLAERRLARHVDPIAFSIPEELLTDGREPKERLLATHVVDPEVASRVGAPTSYAFDGEDAYYADLRGARFGVTTRKAGWDCLRHYELAASGCVPCFRDLHAKPARCAPHGLDETNCVPYRDADELLHTLETIDDVRYAELRDGALAWARRNTTRARAHELLAALGYPQPTQR